MAKILIVGGGGFIGSHTCLSLLESSHNLIVIDNFCNSSPIALDRVRKLANVGKESEYKFIVKKGDVRDRNFLKKIFEDNLNTKDPIQAVIHFAGLKSVKESISKPINYWDTNVLGTINLLKVMNQYNCKVFVFSSSAIIYGSSNMMPIPENAPINPLNPYGNTKVAIEKVLFDIAGCNGTNEISITSKTGWRIARLRYFNPVGAHESGQIGEDPKGIPNNLFPYISEVASGKRNFLKIFGDNWPTEDGTGIRDYIHVMDLAEGHCFALEKLLKSEPQLLTLNLGTGKGKSVLKVLNTYEEIIKKKIPYKIFEKREGDSAIAVADVSMAKNYLNWEAKRELKEMCFDSWKWKSHNLNGYI